MVGLVGAVQHTLLSIARSVEVQRADTPLCIAFISLNTITYYFRVDFSQKFAYFWTESLRLLSVLPLLWSQHITNIASKLFVGRSWALEPEEPGFKYLLCHSLAV